MTPNKKLVWQYSYYDEWKSYTPEQNAAINEAYSNNQITIELQLKKKETAVKFQNVVLELDKMIHIYTGQNRSIEILRRAMEGPDKTYSNVLVPRFEMGWQWEGDGEKWTDFGPDHLYAINEAVSQDQTSVRMTVNNVEFDIDVDAMVQRNCRTGWERRIRCFVKDQICIDGCMIHKWMKNARRSGYAYYNAKQSMVIENAVRDGKESVEVQVGRDQVRIEMNKLTQTNLTTKTTQKYGRFGDQRYKFPNALPKFDESSKVKKRAHSELTSEASTSETVLEADVKPVKRAKSSSAKAKSQGVKQEAAVKTVRISTAFKVPLDPECHAMQGSAHVYIDGSNIYDAMLNQTNLKNNNNKFYVIQLLEDNAKKVYNVWFRWGRVGKSGQNSLVACGHDLSKAKATFEKKYWDKTNNEWDARDTFEKVAGKYDVLTMDYSTESSKEVADTNDEADSAKVKQEKVESKLDQRVQDLIQLICNLQAMEDTVIEMKYDAEKAPLGKLTTNQLRAGYAALKKIEQCINNGTVGDPLIRACDEFYTRIPHNFGMRRPPVIKTKQELKDKIALLEALGDIQVAMTILKGKGSVTEHPIDSQYNSLKCKLEPLEKTNKDYKLIEQYVLNTHAKTHNQYKMKVDEIFEMDREGETENFKDVGNKMMLWHGSRLTNWAGILGQGLRIAPPEAPVTGYMFGKGVYFADMSSKSANYCFASRSKNEGILLLSQVALGTSRDLLAADYNADKLPKGKHSVKGLGKIAPDAAANQAMVDGTIIPVGKGTDTGVNNPNGYTLNYNEFIVYNTNQIRMRYLVKIKFNFD